MKRLLLCALCLLIQTGCTMEWMFPDVAKAQTEKQQYEELLKQRAILERQTNALERIASALEKQCEK